MSEVDRLEVKVEAQARGANSQLDKLVQKLAAVKSSLIGIDGSGLIGLANGVGKLAVSMQGMNNVKTTDFTRLARNIQALGSVNTAGLNSTASAMLTITNAFNSMGTVSNNAAKVGELAKAISKLGNKSVATAIINIPQLSSALKQMMQTLSGAPTVSRDLIDMTNAMASVSASASKTASTSKNLSKGFKQYAESTRKAKESSKSLAYYFGKLYASYFILIRGAKALASAIQSSMDYIEEYNYFNVTLDKVASEWSNDWEKYGYESANAYGDSFKNRLTTLMSKMSGYQMNSDGTLTDLQSNNLGLDVTALTNYSAGLVQVTNSLGLTGEASTVTSKALTMLAGDMSSFRNLDLSSVMTNFLSGLIGQSRALYKYGIDITNATLANYAFELGLSKSVSEMSQSEKMQLRMIAILDQSKVAWGDLSNTINSPSNQLRLLKNNFTALSRTIGNIFLPVVAKVLPYINGLVIAVRRLFTWIGSLLGVNLAGIIGASSAGYTDAFDDLADDADDTSSAIDDATKSANKFKQALLGIDEINTLGTNDDAAASGSASGGASGTIDLTDQLSAALADYEKVWNEALDGMDNTANKYADDVVGFFKGIAKYAEPSVTAVKNLWNDGMSKLGDFKNKALTDFMDDFLIPLGKWTLGTGFPRLVNVTNDFLNDIDWTTLNNNLKRFWKNIEPFAEGVGEGMIDFFKAMLNIGSGLINGLGRALGFFDDTLEDMDPHTLKNVGEALGIIIGAIAGFKALMGLASTIDKIKSSTGGLLTVLGNHPILALAAAVTTLATAYFAFKDVKPEWADNIESINDTFNNSYKDADLQARAMKDLASEYEILRGKAKPTNDEVARMQTISETLVGYYPELESFYNKESGLLNANAEDIKKVIEQKEKEIKVKAYEEKLLTLQKSLLELEDKATESAKNLTDAKQDYLNTVNDLKKKLELGYISQNEYNKSIEDCNDWLHRFVTADNEAQEALQGTQSEYDKTSTKMTEYRKSVEDASTATEESATVAEESAQKTETAYSEAVSGVQTSFSDLLTHVKNIATDMGKAGTEGGEDYKNAVTQQISELPGLIGGLFSEISGAVDAAGAGSNMGWSFVEGIIGTIGGLKDTVIGGVKNLFGGFQMGIDVTTGEQNGLAIGFNVNGYANGGFPSQGQYFLAREKGPELVGMAGNKSAVVNNEQIYEGISESVGPAVYNAVVAAMSEGEGRVINVDNTVVLDSDVIGRSLNNYNSRNNRRYDK